MPKYLSGRVKKTPQSQLPDDRNRYLTIANAEPNIGDPSLVPRTLPIGQQYQVISILGYPGERYWIPVGGGLIPGSITVYDEGIVVPNNAGVSSISQLNFVGAAVSAKGYLNPDGTPGIGVTITIFSPGNNKEVLFNDNNEFGTSTKLIFDKVTGLFTAGDRITVGSGGTVITTTESGLVGIGVTNPTQKLHLQGDLRLTGTIYDWANNPGTNTQVLVKNNFGGIVWANQETIRAGAGGTYQNIQYHNSAGLVDGASTFVFDEINSRVGIGSTLPKTTLDIIGISSFKGGVTIDNLRVTEVTTTETLAVSGTSTTRNLLVTGISTLGYLNGTSSNFTGIVTASKFVGSIDVSSLYVVGVSTFKQKVNIDSDLGVTGLTSTRNLQVYDSTTLNRLNVSGISTFNTQVNINNLNVSGVGTFDNIKIYNNNIETNIGNLILNSSAGTIEVIDSLYINDTTESISKDNGSIYTEGGVGIEKRLNVGGEVSLATQGGITTTGGDFYVGGDLYVKDDIYYDEISGRRAEFTEFLKTKDFQVTGIATIATLGVSGLTTTRNLKVIGISTFDGYIDANGGAYIDNIQIGITGDNEIDTSVGNLTIDSAGGTTTIDDNLIVSGTSSFNGNVTIGNESADTVVFTAGVNSDILPLTNNSRDLGSSSLRWNEIYATTFNGQFIGNADTATKLQTARNIAITGDLAWNVNFDGSTNVTSTGTLANTGVSAGTYGSSTAVGQFTVDTKGRITSASNVNVNFAAATVLNSDNIKTVSTATNATFYPTFVDSNNGTAAYESLYTDAGLSYNPSTNLLSVSGNFSSGGKIIPSAGTGDNGIVWNSDPGGGSGDVAFIQYYAQSGENTRLHIGIRNDSDDDLYLEATETTVSGNLSVLGSVTFGGTSQQAIGGITIKDEGTTVGTANGITSINFVGDDITATASGANATITLTTTAAAAAGAAAGAQAGATAGAQAAQPFAQQAASSAQASAASAQQASASAQQASGSATTATQQAQAAAQSASSATQQAQAAAQSASSATQQAQASAASAQQASGSASSASGSASSASGSAQQASASAQQASGSASSASGSAQQASGSATTATQQAQASAASAQQASGSASSASGSAQQASGSATTATQQAQASAASAQQASGSATSAAQSATAAAQSAAQAESGSFQTGTTLLFYQANAPTGWTKVTTHNNKALRVVSGTGGGSGGNTAFTSVFTSRTPSGSVSVSGSNSGGSVSNTTLTTTQIPSHSHTYEYREDGFVGVAGYDNTAELQLRNTGATGGNGAHNHGFTNPSWSGSGSFSGTAMDFNVQYIDVIIASKD
jgi:hypothetical protein